MTAARPEMNKIPDLLGWNIYPGWYRRRQGGLRPRSWIPRATPAGTAASASANTAPGANTAQHEQNPQHPKPGGQWHPEEWQAEVHEAAWAAIKAAAVCLGHLRLVHV